MRFALAPLLIVRKPNTAFVLGVFSTMGIGYFGFGHRCAPVTLLD